MNYEEKRTQKRTLTRNNDIKRLQPARARLRAAGYSAAPTDTYYSASNRTFWPIHGPGAGYLLIVLPPLQPLLKDEINRRKRIRRDINNKSRRTNPADFCCPHGWLLLLQRKFSVAKSKSIENDRTCSIDIVVQTLYLRSQNKEILTYKGFNQGTYMQRGVACISLPLWS